MYTDLFKWKDCIWLLAIIEDGFSQIREVKTSTSNQNNVNGEMNSSLKSSNILSTLFGVTLSANWMQI
jgi:hypothetical protein